MIFYEYLSLNLAMQVPKALVYINNISNNKTHQQIKALTLMCMQHVNAVFKRLFHGLYLPIYVNIYHFQ